MMTTLLRDVSSVGRAGALRLYLSYGERVAGATPCPQCQMALFTRGDKNVIRRAGWL